MKAVDIKTLVYPGFRQIFSNLLHLLLTRAEGTSMVTDTIYGARFKHIDELRRMNAKLKWKDVQPLLMDLFSYKEQK